MDQEFKNDLIKIIDIIFNKLEKNFNVYFELQMIKELLL